MPAYRSAAEAEVRDAVVARIRQHRADARIIHEINASDFGNRIDVLAVSQDEIIAVEIKSAKDKLDRLPAQIAAMKGAAHHVVAALHEKFLVEQVTNRFAAHSERDGVFYLRDLPDDVRRGHHGVEFWIYPEARRAMRDGHDNNAIWRFPAKAFATALPSKALAMLWRAELYELCGSLRLAPHRRATMAEMTTLLRWHSTGAEITRGICAALRARRCIEADPEILSEAA